MHKLIYSSRVVSFNLPFERVIRHCNRARGYIMSLYVPSVRVERVIQQVAIGIIARSRQGIAIRGRIVPRLPIE